MCANTLCIASVGVSVFNLILIVVSFLEELVSMIKFTLSLSTLLTLKPTCVSISNSDINNSEVLISLGISDDWSFEEHFVLQNNVEVVAYDASVNFRFWLKRVFIETIKNSFNLYALKKYYSYKSFFKN